MNRTVLGRPSGGWVLGRAARGWAVVLCMVALLAPTAGAQQSDAHGTPYSAEFERIRQAMLDGKTDQGRRLADSLLKEIPTESTAYGDALYWRAALAPTAAEAERVYRRLLIEYPLAQRAEDAMLQLAQLQHSRGERRGAAERLQRYMLIYGDSPARPRVSVWLVRLYFEQNQTDRGCEALRAGREEIPPENAELRNQLEYFASRCTVAEAAAADTTRAAPARPAAAAPAPDTPFYSVQVAAYDSPEAAARMAQSMVARGLDARVDGSARPYRVRVGRYATRAEAVRALESLKVQGMNGFVAIIQPR